VLQDGDISLATSHIALQVLTAS